MGGETPGEDAEPMKVLDEDTVRSLLRMSDLIPVIAAALADLSSGKVIQPVRTVLPVDEHKGFFGLMPAYHGVLGAKLVTFYPTNKDIPTHNALIVLFRPETGEPLAVIDGRLITEMRTAAASAVATDLLARPDARVLAILGSGVQAESHLEALRLVRDLREVRVWSPRNAGAFAERFGVTASNSPEDAVRGADVIVTATASMTPVLRGEWLSQGCHINAVGACRPTWRELDDETLKRAEIYVDSRDAALVESGDIIAAGSVFAEVGDVINGSRMGRRSDDQITLFKSLGVAVEDIATADLVQQLAARAGTVSVQAQ